jgi:hypothetical protein
LSKPTPTDPCSRQSRTLKSGEPEQEIKCAGEHKTFPANLIFESTPFGSWDQAARRSEPPPVHRARYQEENLK